MFTQTPLCVHIDVYTFLAVDSTLEWNQLMETSLPASYTDITTSRASHLSYSHIDALLLWPRYFVTRISVILCLLRQGLGMRLYTAGCRTSHNGKHMAIPRVLAKYEQKCCGYEYSCVVSRLPIQPVKTYANSSTSAHIISMIRYVHTL